MTENTTNLRPAHYCPRCTNVLEDGAPECPDCGSEIPPDGWASIQDGYDAWLGRSLDERYFINKRIGRGSVGAVYRAKSVAIARSFAIKIVNLKQTPAGLDADQIRARLKREVSAIGRLRNPHIVPFYETLELYGSFIGVVMDLVEGQTLEDLVGTEPLPQKRALKILRQIANGLHEAHNGGMIHRDLKPENIMVERLPAGDDFVHILDFGIVRVDDGVSMTRGFLGTPLYASPEQAMAGEVDARSDIYALGAVLFFMLTGRPPYLSENVYEILRAHVGAPIPKLNDHSEILYSPELEELISKMLAKAPSNRPQSLAHVIEQIDLLQSGFSAVSDSGNLQPISDVRQTGENPSLGSETSEQELGATPDTPSFHSSDRDKTGPKAAIFKRGPTRGTVRDMIEQDKSSRTLEYDYVVKSETGVFSTGMQVGEKVTFATSGNNAIACVTNAQSIWVKLENKTKLWASFPKRNVSTVTFIDDRALVGTDDGEIIEVFEDGKQNVLFSDVRRAKFTSIDASGGIILAGSESGRLYRRRLADDAGWTRIQDGPPIDVVRLSEDGQLVAVARRTKEVEIFRTNDPKKLVSKFTTKANCRALAFSNDCQLVASALDDDSVSILHVVAQHVLMNVKGEIGSLISLYFNEKNELRGFFEKEGVLFGLDLNRTLVKVQS